MTQTTLTKDLLRLPLDERLDLVVALAQSVADEARQKLPPGPVAHIANLRYAARELRRVAKIDYGYQEKE
ncbi:MAG: hypothetical protein BroJett011_41770 [Chloroflexota bacterium]|nr:MAG: hypothetical protein BroJett011_41770 [Chloroflexota bacterium]